MESEDNNQLNTKNNEPSSKKASKHKKHEFSTQNSDSSSVTEDSSDSSDAFIPDIEYAFNSSNAVCTCCYEWANEMYKCYRCNRKYHKECHIPTIIARNENEKEWECTLCEDITTISKDLGKYHDIDDISVGTVGRKIVERILMELFCRNKEIDHFIYAPNPAVFQRYPENIRNLKGLYNIKVDLLTNDNYKSLNIFLEDIKQMFVNAMSYYSVGDPYLKFAIDLLKFFNTMYDKWIMSPSKKAWKISEQMAV
ncbi:E3 ubiquitin-protein ligase TRIM33-like [Melanaphis sacchari]|uniref:E3 ubiquitin-protein ligase TRIM33-like n=1 Tax=Melanaphis sacchari TaxID=742174 RepID=UPI000DC1586F|nr:E3 ubiquitin-protein ligase TRIM33-like [Melanaphis sacchari]